MAWANDLAKEEAQLLQRGYVFFPPRSLPDMQRDLEEASARKAADNARLKQEQEKAQEKAQEQQRLTQELDRQQPIQDSRRELEETLARQAAEIARLKQELERRNQQAEARQESQRQPPTARALNVETGAVNGHIKPPVWVDKHSLQTSYGTHLLLGYSSYWRHDLKARTEVSFVVPGAQHRSVNGNMYEVDARYSRVGIGLDYRPWGNSPMYVSAGVSINNIESKYTLRGSQVATINGKTAVVDKGDLNVNVQFPTISPIVGVGYELSNASDMGWHGDVRLGLLLGKRKIRADSNLNGVNGITIQDLNAEVNKFNESVVKGYIIPEVTFGFSYNF